MIFRILTPALLAGALAAAPARAEPPRAVPDALLPILNAAEKALTSGEPKAALAALAKWEGEPDALHRLLLGAAHQDLGQAEEAEAAFREAMQLDPELRAAQVGLARALVDREAWDEAAAVLGQLVNVDEAKAPELGLYARVAYERRDLRLASLLVERGIVRFPNDRAFRRLDIAVLLEREAWSEAREAARALLAAEPADGRVWRQLAAATERTEAEPELRLAVLEAAAIANPQDLGLARRHVQAQLAAGHGKAALHHLAPQIRERPGDAELIELGVRAAELAGDREQARAWLAAVPDDARTEALMLLEARLAIDAGEIAAGRAALDRLIRAGHGTSQVFLWAGQLAERAGDPVEAEVMYQQAAARADRSGRLATLYLARLLHDTRQTERARDVLTEYLAAHPEDGAARALLEVIGAGPL